MSEIGVLTKKDNGLIGPINEALNHVIETGDYAKVLEKWGKLTNDDIDQIAGKRDQLVGKVQEKYGLAKEAAEREVDDWTRGT